MNFADILWTNFAIFCDFKTTLQWLCTNFNDRLWTNFARLLTLCELWRSTLKELYNFCDFENTLQIDFLWTLQFLGLCMNFPDILWMNFAIFATLCKLYYKLWNDFKINFERTLQDSWLCVNFIDQLWNNFAIFSTFKRFTDILWTNFAMCVTLYKLYYWYTLNELRDICDFTWTLKTWKKPLK